MPLLREQSVKLYSDNLLHALLLLLAPRSNTVTIRNSSAAVELNQTDGESVPYRLYFDIDDV